MSESNCAYTNYDPRCDVSWVFCQLVKLGKLLPVNQPEAEEKQAEKFYRQCTLHKKQIGLDIAR